MTIGTIDVFYNLNDVYLAFNSKCNIVDTLFGTILINNLADTFHSYSKVLSFFEWGAIALRVLDLSTIVSDIADFGMQLQVIIKHHDTYNCGFFAGKATKVLMQAYMQGWI